MSNEAQSVQHSEPAAAEAPAPRAPIAYHVPVESIRLNQENYLNRAYFMHLPSWATVQDPFDHPEMFTDIQKSPRSLRKYDELRIFLADESAKADTVVMAANATNVTLSKPRITKLESRTASTFETEDYQLRFDGANGWRVWHKKNQCFVTNGVASEQVAREELMRLYPRRAG